MQKFKYHIPKFTADGYDKDGNCHIHTGGENTRRIYRMIRKLYPKVTTVIVFTDGQYGLKGGAPIFSWRLYRIHKLKK